MLCSVSCFLARHRVHMFRMDKNMSDSQARFTTLSHFSPLSISLPSPLQYLSTHSPSIRIACVFEHYPPLSISVGSSQTPLPPFPLPFSFSFTLSFSEEIISSIENLPLPCSLLLLQAQIQRAIAAQKDVFVKLCLLCIFLIYPSISSQVLQYFQCRNIEGVWYMSARMEEYCFDDKWYNIHELRIYFHQRWIIFYWSFYSVCSRILAE